MLITNLFLSQISGGATSANLVTDTSFPYFFSSNINGVSNNIVRLAFIRKYGWKRIAVIMQTNSNLYLSVGQHFLSVLRIQAVFIAINVGS